MEVNGISGIAILVMLLAAAFLTGLWVGQQYTKEGTPSASHNKPIPLASPIFEDGIAVIVGEYLPQRTIMASRDLYAQLKELPSCSSKTAE